MRGPFTYMTTNTLQPDTGYLRTYVGTGDKENLLDKGSVCRLSNPRACAAQGCDVNNTHHRRAWRLHRVDLQRQLPEPPLHRRATPRRAPRGQLRAAARR